MAVIKDHCFIEDTWVYYEPDLTPSKHVKGVIFTLQNFTACSHYVPKDFKLGIKLANHDSVLSISKHINTLNLISLEFPAFSDGRAFSQAQSLRQQLGYNGEIRATGNVLVDQYSFMLQCGFDSFEVPGNTKIEQWKAAARIIPATYTPSQARNYSHIWKLRQVLNG